MSLATDSLTLDAEDEHWLNAVGAALVGIAPAQIEATIARVLEQLGTRLQASRCAILQLTADEQHFTAQSEWVAAGERSRAGEFRHQPTAPFEPLLSLLQTGRVVAFSDVATIPTAFVALREAVAVSPTAAILLSPLLLGTELVGVLSVSVRTQREWLPSEQTLVHRLCLLLASAQERVRVEESLARQLNYQRLVSRLSLDLVNVAPEDFPARLEQALRDVGEFLAVDRCCLYMHDADGDTFSMTHEWCREGIAPRRSVLQRLPLESFSQPVADRLRRMEVVQIEDILHSSDEWNPLRALLAVSGTRSVVNVPVPWKGKLVGYLGLSSLRPRPAWAVETVEVLTLVARLIANVVDRQNHTLALQRRARYERLLTELGISLVNVEPQQLSAAIENALGRLCEFLNASRAALFMLRDGGETVEMTHEWSAPGIPLQGDSYRRFPLGGFPPWAVEQARMGQPFFVPHLDQVATAYPDLAARLASSGTRAVANAPLMNAGQFTGWISISSRNPSLAWPEETLDILKLLAELLGNALSQARTQQELQTSRLRYQAVVEDQTELIARWRPAGPLSFVNAAFRRWFPASFPHASAHSEGHAFPPADEAPLDLPALLARHLVHADRRRLQESLDALTAEQPSVSLQLHFFRPNDQSDWLEWNFRGLFDPTGTLVELQAVGRDVSVTRRTQQQLQRGLKFERLVSWLSAELINAPPDAIDELIAESLDSVGRHTACAQMAIYEFSEDYLQVRLIPSHDAIRRRLEPYRTMGADWRPLSGMRMTWIWPQCLRGDPVIINDLNELPPQAAAERAIFSARGVSSLLHIPLKVGERVVGFLYAERLGTPQPWDDEIRSQMSLVGQICANALHRNATESQLSRTRLSLSRTIRETTSGVIILNDNGLVEMSNRSAQQLFAATADELQQVRLLSDQVAWSIVDSAGQRLCPSPETFSADLAAALSTSRDEPWRLITRNNVDRWIRLHGTEFDRTEHAGGHWLVMIDDVTEARRHQERLQRHIQLDELVTRVSTSLITARQQDWSDRMQQGLAVMGEAVRADRAHICLLSSDEAEITEVIEWAAADVPRASPLLKHAAVRSFGWAANRLRDGQPVVMGDMNDFPALEQQLQQTLNRLGTQSGVALPLLWDRRLYGVLAFGSVTRTHAFESDVVGILTLLSQAFASALARREAESVREALIAELEAKNAELEQFTYTVSHDLKSPLVSILGFSRALKEDVTEGNAAAARDDVEEIDHAANSMKGLLEELLELSRIGRMDNPREPVSLWEVTHGVLREMSGPIENQSVQVTVAADLPVLLANRARVHCLMQNLIENAIKFSDPPVQVEVFYRRDDSGRPVICVADNGIGIEPHHQQRIFRMFEKLHSDRPGTGMGLALVKRIVELHGGTVWVESAGPQRGSCFCFTLPVRET